MSCVNYDDWVHVDDYDKEVTSLEDEITDLKEEIEARKDNETFTLAEVILVRDKLLRGELVEEVVMDLNRLISYHDVAVREAAISKLNEMEGI